MTAPHRLVVLWIVMCLCMMLHFSYRVSGIFYGVDVRSPDAAGVVPPALIVLRLLFNLVPMAFAVATTFLAGKAFRTVTLGALAPYALAHAAHLFGEIRTEHPDPSQVMLLTFTLGACLLQTAVAWRWFRTP